MSRWILLLLAVLWATAVAAPAAAQLMPGCAAGTASCEDGETYNGAHYETMRQEFLSHSASITALQSSVAAIVPGHGNGTLCALGTYARASTGNGSGLGCTADDDIPESGDFGAAAALTAAGALKAGILPFEERFIFRDTIEVNKPLPFKLRRATTLSGFGCKCQGGSTCTGVTVSVSECDGPHGATCNGSGLTVTLNANNVHVEDLVATDGIFDAGDYGEVTITALGQASDVIVCDVFGTH